MKILGLDLGSRTLGIAMSDENEKIAFMKETFRFEEDDYDAAIDKILEYIDDYKLKDIVLGLPKHMNGDIGERAEISMQFKDILEDEREVTVHLVDERLTTSINLKISAMLGNSSSKRKKNIDSMAAVTILQDYLDKKNG